jgi:hypothetical protein
VALLLAALLGRGFVDRSAAPLPAPERTSAAGVRLFTRAELARHDGRAGSDIWLALCGQARARRTQAVAVGR